MSSFLPHRRSTRFVLGLVLVDLPVLVAAVVCGIWLGFGHTISAVMEWRVEHPWSLIPTAVVFGLLVYRLERRR